MGEAQNGGATDGNAPPSALGKHERQALAVALLTTQGKSQTDIASDLGLKNQTEVSRLRKYAEDNRLLTWEVHYPSGVHPEEIQMLAFPELEDLKKELTRVAHQNRGVAPETISVVHCGPPDADDRHFRFGAHAGRIIVPLIQTAETCAVAWGRTIDATIAGIPPQGMTPFPELKFIPIAGEPFNYDPSDVSPSGATALLADRFGCKGPPLSLRGVSARIPNDTKAVPAATIRRFYSWCRDYRMIFGDAGRPGGSQGLIAKVDMILTGIGDADTSVKDPWFEETVDLEKIDAARFAEIAAGNIGGVWLPEEKVNAKKVENINRRSLGIQREHYISCAKRADRKGGPPGVIVLAVEAAKWKIIRHAAGMFNHLICSRKLAARLLEELRAEG